jgi:hypothetical protein
MTTDPNTLAPTIIQFGQIIGEFLIGLIVAFVAWKQKRNTDAIKENTAITTATSLTANSTAAVVKDIHTLSNSAMGAQLKGAIEVAEQVAVLAHRLAESGAAGDVAVAAAADLKVAANKVLYQEHQIQQAKVDATKTTAPVAPTV